MRRRKRLDQRARMPLVNHLDTIGFTSAVIGELMGWSATTIAADIRALGERRAAPEDRPQKENIFATALRTYAWLTVPATPGQEHFGDSQRAPLVHVLAQWLRVEEVIGAIEGIELARGRLTRPDVLPQHVRMFELLDAIFGSTSLRSSLSVEDLRANAEASWSRILGSIAAERMSPPQSRDALMAHLARIAEEWRAFVVQTPSDAALGELRDAVRSLPREQRRAVSMRFGVIDADEQHTFHAIGRALDKNAAEARTLVLRSIRSLRHPRVLPLCRTYMRPRWLRAPTAQHGRDAGGRYAGTRRARVSQTCDE